MNEIILDAMSVLDIKCLDKKTPLKSTKTDKIPEFEYRRYANGKRVFTVKEDEGFFEALMNGNVYQVKLNEVQITKEIEGKDTVIDSYDFLNYITAAQKTGVVKMLGTITQLEKSFTVPVVDKLEALTA